MPTRDIETELLIVGGGVGGVAAAVTAARLGVTVTLTEPTDWLGGQLTTQAVPPDEHEWIDTATISPSYSELRERIRDHYRRNYPLTAAARADPLLNPGSGFVSRLCHEPRVAASAIDEMLSPLVAAGRLTILLEHEPIAAERDGDQVRAVTFRDTRSGDVLDIHARWVADASELGDLLELARVDHVIGAESHHDTGEAHAPDQADPLDQQAVTWCAALEYRAGEDHTIPRPLGYEHWASTTAPFWPGPQLSWDDVDPISLRRRTRPLFTGSPEEAIDSADRDLWHYRRILARKNLREDWPGGDITLMNWPQADYWEKPLLGVSRAEAADAQAGARDLTLSFIHWMQTEAPRSDGGRGYPELRLRGDAMGTSDGLAKAIYVREARRIRALFTVTEEHIGKDMRGEHREAAVFDDTVGIGYYRIDLHPSTAARSYIDIDCFPFQIPLGALIPRGVDNLLAAAKNIGTTHVTNGAYRLHPVEWSIGEAVGALVAYCRTAEATPEQVRSRSSLLEDYQRLLTGRLGISLDWDSARRVQQREAAVLAR